MIDSKIKFFSPLHKNYKLDLIFIGVIIFIIWGLLVTEENFTYKVISSILIINWIIITKIYDFYYILENKKKTIIEFKKWLDFMKTKYYKILINLIYLYLFSNLICITIGFMYFYNSEGYFRKILGIFYICSTLLHLAGTYIKYKKIKI